MNAPLTQPGGRDTHGSVVVFAGGGSGGHVYPGLAVAEAMTARSPDIVPLFLCTERDIDRRILSATPFEFIAQPIVPPTRTVGGLLRFWQGWRATNDLVRRLLADRKPLAVLGLGGYAAGVAVKQAGRARGGQPVTAMLNPDVVPGRANVYLMHACRRIYAGYERTVAHVPPEHRGKCIVTGCPLRRDARPPVERSEAVARLGLDLRRSTLVVTGASQGAKSINEAVIATAADILRATPGAWQGWQVLHLAGADHADDVRAAWRAAGMSVASSSGGASTGPDVRVLDFTPHMGDVWASADLAISRSGAGSCAELAAFGVPGVLMPYPFHKDMHQTANARVLADAGGAVLLEDQRDARANAARLRPVLEGLLHDAPRRQSMGQSARSAAPASDAAERVAADLSELIDAADSGAGTS